MKKRKITKATPKKKNTNTPKKSKIIEKENKHFSIEKLFGEIDSPKNIVGIDFENPAHLRDECKKNSSSFF